MECSDSQVSCQLGRIADAMTGFDVNGFLATLIATLVGALIAGAVSIALYRREAANRTRGEVDAAVVTLIRAIQEYSGALRQWQLDIKSHAMQLTFGRRPQPQTAPRTPDRSTMDTAVEALVVLTAKSERRVADATRQILYELTFMEDEEQRSKEFAAVRRVLVAWRAKRRSDAETIASLELLDTRRVMIVAGKDEQTWPPLPEPYERASEKKS